MDLGFGGYDVLQSRDDELPLTGSERLDWLLRLEVRRAIGQYHSSLASLIKPLKSLWSRYCARLTPTLILIGRGKLSDLAAGRRIRTPVYNPDTS